MDGWMDDRDLGDKYEEKLMAQCEALKAKVELNRSWIKKKKKEGSLRA